MPSGGGAWRAGWAWCEAAWKRGVLVAAGMAAMLYRSVAWVCVEIKEGRAVNEGMRGLAIAAWKRWSRTVLTRGGSVVRLCTGNESSVCVAYVDVCPVHCWPCSAHPVHAALAWLCQGLACIPCDPGPSSASAKDMHAQRAASYWAWHEEYDNSCYGCYPSNPIIQ